MISLKEYILNEARNSTGAKNDIRQTSINWAEFLPTGGNTLDAYFELKKIKAKNPDTILNEFLPWLIENEKDNNAQKLLKLIVERDGHKSLHKNDDYMKLCSGLMKTFMDKNKISSRVPRSVKFYDMQDALSSIFLACCTFMKPGFMKMQIENFKSSASAVAPVPSGKIAINRKFDTSTNISFEKYISEHPIKEFKYISSELNKTLVYIYFDENLRKLFTTKSAVALNKDGMILDAVLNTFEVYGIADVKVNAHKDSEDELLLSSEVSGDLYKLCDAYGPRGMKKMFDGVDISDERSYIIVNNEKDATFIETYLLDDIKTFEPNIIVKLDKAIKAGYYAITDKIKKFEITNYNCPKFEAFFTYITSNYINNYKGPMPL